MPSKPQRYYILDGMRGVAALMVAAYHLAVRQSDSAFPGYLAVDLFFVISGFVIALNYTGRLESGLTVRRFTELRLIRLFPLYAIGLLLGIARTFASYALHGADAIPPAELACDTFFAALMLPTACSPYLFPLNGPSWSLFFEVVVNIAFAVILWRLRTVTLACLMVAAAAYLCFAIGAPDYFDVGWAWSTALEGIARTAFSFPAGVLIFRLACPQSRRTTWLAAIPVLLVAALILVDVPPGARMITQSLIIFLAFPLLVLVGVRAEAPPILAKIFGLFGDLSYPIYAIHWPLIALALPIANKLHLSALAASMLFLLVLLPAAFAASLVDSRTRAWVSDWLHVRRTAPTQIVQAP